MGGTSPVLFEAANVTLSLPDPDPPDPLVFGLPDPDPLVSGMDPDSSIIKQK
jgi:hypothetical protein